MQQENFRPEQWTGPGEFNMRAKARLKFQRTANEGCLEPFLQFVNNSPIPVNNPFFATRKAELKSWMDHAHALTWIDSWHPPYYSIPFPHPRKTWFKFIMHPFWFGARLKTVINPRWLCRKLGSTPYFVFIVNGKSWSIAHFNSRRVFNRSPVWLRRWIKRLCMHYTRYGKPVTRENLISFFFLLKEIPFPKNPLCHQNKVVWFSLLFYFQEMWTRKPESDLAVGNHISR